jgi:hypothetical protein
MARFNSRLDNLRVAAPCPASWDRMYGNDRVRFCGECQLNVYNLSEMSRADAERLIAHSEGRLCVRYYRRRDGSIITQNCPVGLRAIKRRLSRVATAVATSVLSFLAGIGFYRAVDELQPHVVGRMIVGDVYRSIPSVQGAVAVTPPPEVGVTVGKLVRIDPPKHLTCKPRKFR